MQPGVVSIESGATISEVARVMTQKSVRNIFITRAGEPTGLVRDWDIITKVVAFNLNPDLVTVDEIMYTPPPIVRVDADLSEIAGLMAETGVRRVAVVEAGKIRGTITAGMLLGVVSSFPKSGLREIFRKIQRET
jgi:CBS domain-containing protein